MRLAYVTAQVPWGKSEQFVLPEVRAVLRRGHSVWMVPVRPDLRFSWPDGEALRDSALAAPLFTPRYLAAVLFWVRRRPWTTVRLVHAILRRSGSAKKTLKNLLVVPKAMQVARELGRRRIEHVHAHWATTPATMALVACRLADIPWSMTLHRHDIAERNLLVDKVRAASFTRVISEDGRRELLGYVGHDLDPTKLRTIHLIHMGVDLPASPAHAPRPEPGPIVIAARLDEKKGHAYLFQSLALLRDTDHQPVRCLVIGDGPYRRPLETLRRELGLEAEVEFVGQLPHEQLFARYAAGGVAAVVLPSVTAPDGEREGIPVALMEAMAFGIPVIATPNGGTAELVDGAGVLVPERDATALAAAVHRLLADAAFARATGAAGRRRIEERFATDVVVDSLERLWATDLRRG